MWGIAWRNVCLMMADAPVYQPPESYKKEKVTKPKNKKELISALFKIGKE